MPVFDNTKGKKTLVAANAVAGYFKPKKAKAPKQPKPTATESKAATSSAASDASKSDEADTK